MAGILAGILTITMMTSSCRNNEPGKTESIRLGTLLLETSALIIIAENRNFFKHNGLDVDMKYYDTGLSALKGMLKTEVDIASPVGEYAMVGAILDKEQIQTVASIDKVDYQSIIARRDRGIKNASDLKGRRIGVILGTQQEFYLTRFLELNGIDAKETILVNIRISQAIDLIVNGDIDAVVSPPPYTDTILDKLGNAAMVWSVQSNQLTQQLIICGKEWIAQRPKSIELLLKALRQSEEYMFHHPDEAKAAIQKRLNVTDKDIERIWSQNQFSLSLDQSLVLAMEDEVRWMVRKNLTRGKEIPDFLAYIYAKGLESVKPQSVNLIGGKKKP